MTSLAYIFTMEKAQSRNVFAVNFICQPIFKKELALFTTFEMQKNEPITFCRRGFRTR